MFNYIRKAIIHLLGGYDAAERTPENRKHWRNVPQDVNPSITNLYQVRQRLRLAAQYEQMNNCYCRGLISTLARDTIGTIGPKLQMMTPDRDANGVIEAAWKKWSESPEVMLMEKLNLLDSARRVDGESFIVFNSDTSTKEEREKFNVNVISARRVNNFRYLYPIQDGDIIKDNGVNYNIKNGRAESFDVMTQVLMVGTFSEVANVSSTHMKQWYMPTRPEQIRGVCEIAAALPLFAFLRRYTLATIGAAEFAASMAGVLETASPPGEPSAKMPDFTEVEFVRNTLLSLPEGWKANAFKGEQPNQAYTDFANGILREIGRAVDVPFGVVAGDSSGYNYSSARLDYRGYDDRISFDRKSLTIRIVNPIFAEWFKEFLVGRRDIARLALHTDTYHNWRYAGRAPIDPLKEARADEVRLNTLTTTLASVYGDRGLDWEEELEQRAKESEKLRELGIVVPSPIETPEEAAAKDAIANAP